MVLKMLSIQCFSVRKRRKLQKAFFFSLELSIFKRFYGKIGKNWRISVDFTKNMLKKCKFYCCFFSKYFPKLQKKCIFHNFFTFRLPTTCACFTPRGTPPSHGSSPPEPTEQLLFSHIRAPGSPRCSLFLFVTPSFSFVIIMFVFLEIL